MVPAPPPALTCKLPGPWHDSQPMSVDSFEISPPPFAVLLLTIYLFCLQSRVGGCSEIAHDLFVTGRAFL